MSANQLTTFLLSMYTLACLPGLNALFQLEVGNGNILVSIHSEKYFTDLSKITS